MSRQSGVIVQVPDGTADTPALAVGRRDTGLYITRDANGIPNAVVLVVAGVVKANAAPTTVALLPSAVTTGAGARAFVTDATTPTALATVVGGGAVPVPVFSDGTDWKVG